MSLPMNLILWKFNWVYFITHLSIPLAFCDHSELGRRTFMSLLKVTMKKTLKCDFFLAHTLTSKVLFECVREMH